MSKEPSSAWGSMTVGPAEPLQDSLGGGGCRVGIHWVVFFDPRSSSGTVGRDASLAKSMGENVLDRKNAQERRGDDCAVDDGTGGFRRLSVAAGLTIRGPLRLGVWAVAGVRGSTRRVASASRLVG